LLFNPGLVQLQNLQGNFDRGIALQGFLYWLLSDVLQQGGGG
jgi:hypothetical protein